MEGEKLGNVPKTVKFEFKTLRGIQLACLTYLYVLPEKYTVVVLYGIYIV